ncbi:unnamed protein product, partial [Medioppia subpectinata]
MLNESGDSTSDGTTIHTCRTCETRIVDARYHCGQCDHFDLCVACYQRHGHTHAMDQLTLIGQWVEVAPVANGAGNTGRANAPPADQSAIQRCAQTLAHSCRCRDANCALPSCHKYKKAVQHARRCQRQATSNRLKLVNQKAAAAPGGGDSECPVIYCTTIQRKLRRRVRQRLQQVRILVGRIAAMVAMSGQSPAAPQLRQQQSP